MKDNLENQLTKLGWQVRAQKETKHTHPAYIDAKHKIIWINHRIPIEHYQATLAHQYVHVLLGHNGHKDCSTEDIVDRKVALLLISEAEYANAEQIVGKNANDIAKHLTIPLWVVLAWQATKNFLHDHC